MKYLMRFLSFMEFSNFDFDYEANEYIWNGDGYTDMLVYFRDVYNTYADFERGSWSDNQSDNLAKAAFFSENEDEFVSKSLAIAISELMLDSECQSMSMDVYSYYLVRDYTSVSRVLVDYFDELARRERVSLLS
ncbi:hypothetical protein HND72_17060 [Pseudomonas putida]|uniref:Uncharacterized protein n=1 Tax=Pseudomonas taiwanensis SJ9 TaxID=1388762 RepID=V7DDB9_9PSED|nr:MULTISPECIES: hypothetical protein [Pseudomonas]ESW39226.1 hypothetical protein O164_13445 [Pseudomonas taiwanensis SJ9]MDO1496266.1 hypothetical protein [Pseudomonas putida]